MGVTRNIQAPYLLGHVQRDFLVTFISILWFHESHGHDRNCIAMGVTGVRMGCALPWNRCGSWADSPLSTLVLNRQHGVVDVYLIWLLHAFKEVAYLERLVSIISFRVFSDGPPYPSSLWVSSTSFLRVDSNITFS